MAKIKKEKEQSLMLEEKECTFKPKIIKNNFTKSQVGKFRKSISNHSKVEENSRISQRNEENSRTNLNKNA